MWKPVWTAGAPADLNRNTESWECYLLNWLDEKKGLSSTCAERVSFLQRYQIAMPAITLLPSNICNMLLRLLYRGL